MTDSIDAFWQIVVSVWQSAVFGIGVDSLILALGVFLLFLLARGVFTKIVIGAVALLVKRTENEFDDELVKALDLPLRFVFVVLGVYFAGRIVEFPPEVDAVLVRVVRSLIAFTIFWAIYRCVEPLSFLVDKATKLLGAEGMGEGLKAFFVKGLKFVVACLGIAAFLEEWDFNVAAVLGGLGLVGMALAFGAQNLIANLFAGISIFMDRMFERGDWVRGGNTEGIVESIGFRTTKVRQFDKALVTIPNSVLTGGAVINFSRRSHRRIYWKIGLLYGSSEEQLRQVVERIRDYVETCGEFETDPAMATLLINVDSFNASSIDIMVYCFTKTIKWAEWMEIKERFAYKIKEIVEDAGTSFAFPSTSVYVEQWPFGTPDAFPLGPSESAE